MSYESKSRVCLVFHDKLKGSYDCYAVDIDDGGRNCAPERVFHWTRDCGAPSHVTFGVLNSRLYAIGGMVPDERRTELGWCPSRCTFVCDFANENPSMKPGPNLKYPTAGVRVAQVNNTLYLIPSSFMAVDIEGRFAGFEYLNTDSDTWEEYQHPSLEILYDDPEEETSYTLYEYSLAEFAVLELVVCDSKILVSTCDRGVFIYDVRNAEAGWKRTNTPSLLPFPFTRGLCIGRGPVYAFETGKWKSLVSYSLDDQGKIMHSQTVYTADYVPVGLIHLRNNNFCLLEFGVTPRKPFVEVLQIPPHHKEDEEVTGRRIMFFETEIPLKHLSSLRIFFKVDHPSTQGANHGHSMPDRKQNELRAKLEEKKAVLLESENDAGKKSDEINEQNKILRCQLEALHIQWAEEEHNSTAIPTSYD